MQDQPNVNFRTWGEDNISYGPVELPALVTWLRQGRVLRNTWVFSEQRGEWARAGEMIELKGMFKSGAGAPSATATPGITPGLLRRVKIFVDMDERQLASFLQYMEVAEAAAQRDGVQEGRPWRCHVPGAGGRIARPRDSGRPGIDPRGADGGRVFRRDGGD